MLLTLVRHAKSSWSDPSLSDFDRPLNERGNRDAPRMARWFFENIQEMPILFTSPANRALSTAKYLWNFLSGMVDKHSLKLAA